jgi:hypothetical protein
LPPAPEEEELEGLFADLAEVPESPGHQPTPCAPACKQQRHDDKPKQSSRESNVCPPSRPSPNEPEDGLFGILADLDEEAQLADAV